MKRLLIVLLLGIMCAGAAFFAYTRFVQKMPPQSPKEAHWMLLHRKSNVEYLLYGIPGNREKSKTVRTFTVKAGVPGKKPTPLPQLVGRDYWLITHKLDAKDNEETAPYFLVLDVPIPSSPPFGPEPYKECEGGKQCDWEKPGYFGLHGINGDPSRLLPDNEGSSGCVRHKDEDITYLYKTLNPEKNPARYYIRDL